MAAGLPGLYTTGPGRFVLCGGRGSKGGLRVGTYVVASCRWGQIQMSAFVVAWRATGRRMDAQAVGCVGSERSGGWRAIRLRRLPVGGEGLRRRPPTRTPNASRVSGWCFLD